MHDLSVMIVLEKTKIIDPYVGSLTMTGDCAKANRKQSTQMGALEDNNEPPGFDRFRAAAAAAMQGRVGGSRPIAGPKPILLGRTELGQFSPVFFLKQKTAYEILKA